jgi:hypothetical protein
MGASSPEIELQCEPIKNRKMKTRCFDHIDLRVKNIAVAGKFYAKFLPQLGFVEERPGKKYHMFYSAGCDKPSVFLDWCRTRIISQIARESHSGRIHGKKWIALRSWCVRRTAKRLKVRKSVGSTVLATMRFSSRIWMATSLKCVAGKGQSLPANL